MVGMGHCARRTGRQHGDGRRRGAAQQLQVAGGQRLVGRAVLQQAEVQVGRPVQQAAVAARQRAQAEVALRVRRRAQLKAQRRGRARVRLRQPRQDRQLVTVKPLAGSCNTVLPKQP